jgi:hypothetical protein
VFERSLGLAEREPHEMLIQRDVCFQHPTS